MSSTVPMPGLVSTIIPVRNRPQMLVEAVESVLAQTYRPIEVVIVDDASDDATPETIQALERRAPGVVRSVRRSTAGGPGAAREDGRQVSRGAFVQHLDSDDLLMPSKFEQQVALLEARPELAFVYADVEEHYGAPAGGGRVDRRRLPSVERGFPILLTCRLWQTCAPLYRRDAVDTAGAWLPLFNEEDWEYDARIASMGRPIAKLDRFVGIWRRHGQGHVSGGARARRRTLHHQSIARERIIEHARTAGVPHDAPEMQSAVRALFLLSRQCGAAGLVEDSARLFRRVRELAFDPAAFDLRCYSAAARVAGWRPAGVLAGALDRVRSLLGR